MEEIICNNPLHQKMEQELKQLTEQGHQLLDNDGPFIEASKTIDTLLYIIAELISFFALEDKDYNIIAQALGILAEAKKDNPDLELDANIVAVLRSKKLID